MTGKIVNLGRARKARARADASAKADANSAKFGRTKAQRAAEKTALEQAKRTLDGKQREE